VKNYYRVMLGKQSTHAAECFSGNYIGADFGIAEDLTGQLPDEWKAFNKVFIPKYLALFPGKAKVAAGLACGMLWTVAKGINKGDIVLCPDGAGVYHIGEVTGDYYYAENQALPHRRAIRWFNFTVERSALSESLQKSAGFGGTVITISGYKDELERILDAQAAPRLISTDETVEDPTCFAMEKHLEDFLVQNWEQTELGKTFDIFQEDGERVGQQYPTDTGPLDILAISKDKKQLLVVELKRGRASDVVVGQTLRYMGFVSQELAEPGQETRGVIIALDDDQRIRRALAVTPNIDFYRYQVSFKLLKG
jgi:restriction system protein